MTYELKFVPYVEGIICKWKRSNPHLHKKLVKVLQDIAEHPRMGIGHPEPLKGGDGMTFSRHISAHDRIIYDIYDTEVVVLVLNVEGHYNDK